MLSRKSAGKQICLDARNLEGGRALNSAMQTFDSWLAQNKKRIPIE
jgi:hypothetical protein